MIGVETIYTQNAMDWDSESGAKLPTPPGVLRLEIPQTTSTWV